MQLDTIHASCFNLLAFTQRQFINQSTCGTFAKFTRLDTKLNLKRAESRGQLTLQLH